MHSGSSEFIHALLNFARFVRVCVFSLVRSFRMSGSFAFAWVHYGAPSCGRVHSGLRGFTLAPLGLVGFILVRVGFLAGPKVHFLSGGFTQVLLSVVGFFKIARVHSGVQGVAEFILVRVGSLSRALGSTGLFGFRVSSLRRAYGSSDSFG